MAIFCVYWCFCLFNKNCVTYRTMATFCKTCCYTCCCYRFVNNFCMTKCFFDCFATNCTYFCIFTVCCIPVRLVTRCFDIHWCAGEFCTTICTVYNAVVTAVQCTSWLYPVFFNRCAVCMAFCINISIYHNVTTSCTCVCCVTFVKAGWCRNHIIVAVAVCFNISVYHNIATSCTCVCCVTFVETGWCCNHFTVRVAVCFNNCLCNNNCITYGTMAAFCKTCFCTGWCYCCINYFCVAKGINNFLFPKCFATNGTF